MPAWIHDRAEHLLAKNPKMTKSQAFAIATQQSHKLGKSPKGYGTSKGKKKARAKYDKPRKEYVKTPNPQSLESPKLAAMRAELEKEAFLGRLGKAIKGVVKKAPAAPAPAPQIVKKAPGLGAKKFNFRSSKTFTGPSKAGPTPAQQAILSRTPGAQGVSTGKNPFQISKEVKRVKLDDIASESKQLQQIYGGLPQSARSAIEAHPLVASGKMPATSAMQLMHMGRKAGETGVESITRQALSTANTAIPRAAGAARGAVTQATRMPTMATRAPAAQTMATRVTQMGKAAAAMREALVKEALGGGVLKQFPGLKGGTLPFLSRIRTIGQQAKPTLTGFAKASSAELGKEATTQRDNPYMLDQLPREPKVRPRRAEAPNPKYRVKEAAGVPGVFGMATKGMSAGFNPAKQLAKSQKIGMPKPPTMPKMQTMGVKMSSVKEAFQVSQYSGSLGGGPRDIYTPSGMKYGGEVSKDTKGKKVKMSAMSDELAKLNGVATTPAGKLYSTQRVGAPKSTAPPGPSISELSKPVGYGLKAPGAVKDSI